MEGLGKNAIKASTAPLASGQNASCLAPTGDQNSGVTDWPAVKFAQGCDSTFAGSTVQRPLTIPAVTDDTDRSTQVGSR
jgi:hypothetical protein